jgi:DNA invertase Pin-like site-specific DNA recombinase
MFPTMLYLFIGRLGGCSMMTSQRVAYRRVSSIDQSTARQLPEMDSQFDKIFEDKASGKDTNRPELKRALAHLREGDSFTVHSMDRLARNLNDLLTIVKDLTSRGVTVVFVKEHLTFTGNDSAIDKLLLGVLGSCAEFERSMIRERQREGIAIAKAEGRYKGRPRVLSPVQIIEARRRHHENGESYRELAEEMGCSRQTLYTAVAALLEKEQAAL